MKRGAICQYRRLNAHARSTRYFDMICRCGSVREAARCLHRTARPSTGPDYGGGVKYSLFEQNVAIAEWFRSKWQSNEAGRDA